VEDVVEFKGRRSGRNEIAAGGTDSAALCAFGVPCRNERRGERPAFDETAFDQVLLETLPRTKTVSRSDERGDGVARVNGFGALAVSTRAGPGRAEFVDAVHSVEDAAPRAAEGGERPGRGQGGQAHVFEGASGRRTKRTKRVGSKQGNEKKPTLANFQVQPTTSNERRV